MRKRILSVFGANIFGQIITIFVQILSIPLFLHFWGSSLYGEWLVLTALPGYLSISGSGIGFVAGNTMQKYISANDEKEALAVFQSAWVLLFLLSFFLLAVALFVVLIAPISSWLKINHISITDVRTILVVLTLYVLLGLQTELLSSVYRANGEFARSIFIINLLRLVEFIGLGIAVLFGGKAIVAALVFLGVKILGIVWMVTGIKRFTWPNVGFKFARKSIIQSELIPTFSFLGFPLGHAFLIQGMTTVVGVQLGPNAVVVFSAIRTLTGFIKQFASSIYYSVWPEFSGTLSKNELNVARNLHRSAFQITLLFSIASSFFLYFFSPVIFRIWTGGKLMLEDDLLLLMLISAIPNTLWMMSAYVSISINRHAKIALVYSFLAICAAVIAFLLCPYVGLTAVPIATLFCDVLVLIFVLNSSFAIVHDNIREFSVFLISNMPFRNILRVDAQNRI